MANTTDVMATTVHGANPQNMVEKILRLRIYDSLFWKENCFALTAESLVDKSVELSHIGGTYVLSRPPLELRAVGAPCTVGFLWPSPTTRHQASL